jgi:hypothetical protein
MCLSYYRFALDVADRGPDAMFEKYQELYDCVDPDPVRADDSAAAYVDLLNRHGTTVTTAMERIVKRFSSEIARQMLPPTCLTVLVAGREAEREARKPSFAQSVDLRTITMKGQTRTVSVTKGALVRRLKLATDQSLPDVPWSELKKAAESVGANPNSITDVFKDHEEREFFMREVKRGVYRLNWDG